MFDIGFWEMAIVGIVALIVVGPQDLPKMFRTVGKYMGQAKGMARQFQNAMNQAAKETEIAEMKEAMGGVQKGLKAAADPLGQATRSARDYAKSITADFDPAKADAAVTQRGQHDYAGTEFEGENAHFEDQPAEVPDHAEPPRDVTPAPEPEQASEEPAPAEARKD